jgi:hypothetical protein
MCAVPDDERVLLERVVRFDERVPDEPIPDEPIPDVPETAPETGALTGALASVALGGGIDGRPAGAAAFRGAMPHRLQ